jgi:hypothetical protein
MPVNFDTKTGFAWQAKMEGWFNADSSCFQNERKTSYCCSNYFGF